MLPATDTYERVWLGVAGGTGKVKTGSNRLPATEAAANRFRLELDEQTLLVQDVSPSFAEGFVCGCVRRTSSEFGAPSDQTAHYHPAVRLSSVSRCREDSMLEPV